MSVETSPSKKVRPVNLNLLTIRFPITAIVSILHRLSGVLLFMGVPLLIWALDFSLSSPDNFAQLQMFLIHPVFKIILWVFLSALFYHLFAGIRHLVMDLGIGESLIAGKITASLVILISIVFTIILGIYLW